MELKQIEYFLQLAQMQHVSQTADFLNISQPTLSKSLSRLEEDLGVTLFDRVGNRLRLNNNGQHFYESAKQALQILNSASLFAKRSAYEISGNISIACLTFAPILIPCISEYMELNPLANIQLLQYNHSLNRATDMEYDFILLSAQDTLENNQNGWVIQNLFSEKIFFVIGPRHPQFHRFEEDGGDFDLTYFSDASFVTMRLDHHFSDFTYKICQEAGFFPRSYFQTDDFLLKMNILREGLAVAFLPACCIEEAKRLCPGVKVFTLQQASTTRRIQMMRRRKHLLSETALDFWDFLLEHFQLPRDELD